MVSLFLFLVNEEKQRLRSNLAKKKLDGRYHDGQALRLYPVIDSGVSVDELVMALDSVATNSDWNRISSFNEFCNLYSGKYVF